jgi:two-component system chemotaxis response regulator CheB
VATGKRIIQAGGRIRVLVVDDSVVIRRLVTHALGEDASLEVVGSAANGLIALQRIPQVNPDVVTLDIEMPEMDGIETMRRIRKEFPHLYVIMFSTLTERGASATMDALAAGANDYVAKAANAGSLGQSMHSLREELLPKIKQFFSFGLAPAILKPAQPVRALGPGTLGACAGGTPGTSMPIPRRIVAIGVSTGGPTALSEIVPAFPAAFPLPIVIVQHMPPIFTRLLADRLQTRTKLRVEEAAEGMTVEPGRILIAPGDYHMKLRRNGAQVVVTLNQSTPENSCRPAVDVLFRSVAETYGGAAIAAILTGMGQDGLHGVENLKAEGAYVVAQDEVSSVVWGMPGAVVHAGLADAVVDLNSVVPEILKQV